MKGGLFLVFTVLINLAYGKSVTIDLNTNHVSGKDKKFSDFAGGDTLIIATGQRGAIQFADFCGDREKYITIINGNGLCEIKTATLSYGISLRNCHFIRLCGNGCKSEKYGIKIAEVVKDGAGLGISDKTDHVEVCYLEICNTKGPGILCKTNPDCFTSRDNFTIAVTSIHHNYVHNTGTEGMYIGSTAFEGVKMKCDSVEVTEFPSLLDTVNVYDNEVSYTGWDGIQISNSTNVSCFHNNISYDSQKDEPWQNCGLIIGGGSTGQFYENTIRYGKGYGINCFGTGKLFITGNTIVMDSLSTKVAVYLNDKLAQPETTYFFSNNNITTHSLPAVKVVNKKHTKPDELVGNTLNGAALGNGLQYEGLKPEVK